MATSPSRPLTSSTGPNPGQFGLTVTPYDRVASTLIALLILVGTAVAIMLALWWSSRMFQLTDAVPVNLEQIGDGGGLGDSMEMDEDVTEISMETDLVQPEFQQRMSTIADAVAAKEAMLQDPSLFDSLVKGSGGGPRGDGRYPGDGSGRPGKPRRWKIRFADTDANAYARQLDFFGIELGVLMPGGRVIYAYNLTKRTPDQRRGPSDDEKRYYLTWVSGSLEAADRELLKRANIDPGDRPILKFVPRPTEIEMIRLEQQKAGDDANRIRATYFAVQRQGNGYEFVVTDQSYNWGQR